MKVPLVAVFLSILAVPAAHAFLAPGVVVVNPRSSSWSPSTTTTQLPMASTLADKASAIRAAEARNQAEIEALKLQIAQIEDLFNRSPGSIAAATPYSFVDTTKDQLGARLREFRQYLGSLVQQSKSNQLQYDQIIAQQGGGPSLLQALATSAAAGTMGGLVVGALDSNRRDSIGGILAGVAGSAASSLASSTKQLEAPPAAVSVPAPAPVVDSRAPSVVQKVLSAFPGAQSNAELVSKVTNALTRYGYGEKNTLVATSFCCDEVNRPLEEEFAKAYGQPFNMGGLAGFPFGGVTSFAAMAKHVPDGGNCLVVYGPHVGVDFDCKVGTVNRRGKEKGGTCCGSAVAASGYVSSVYKGEIKEATAPTQNIDAQQLYVGSVLLPYAERLANAADSMIELPYSMFEPVDDLTQKIVEKAAYKVGDGKIAMLGGIQINTPAGISDYFLPLRFELRSSKNEVLENLFYEKRF
ncbi:hypothetical protein ACA910_016070 [Epithemia clementina (nom. ined.)]